jgi:hypothetical protein
MDAVQFIPYHIDFYFCLPLIFADYACVVDDDVDSAECPFGFVEGLCNSRQLLNSVFCGPVIVLVNSAK